MSEAAAQAEDAKVDALIQDLCEAAIYEGKLARALDTPEVDSLQLYIAALRADKERLDFLEKHNACIEPVVGNIMPEVSFAVWWCEDHEPDMGKDLRAAIDTAMAIDAARREGS